MKKKKLKIILKNLKKVIKPRHIVLLILLLVGNTYAWFIYATEVSNGVDAHVRAWNIHFEADDNNITDYFYVNIDDVYPGMETYTSELKVENNSEVMANIKYEILEARIFDETLVTVEGRVEKGQTQLSTDLTSEELEEKLENDYPFEVNFSLTNESMDESHGTSTYIVTFNWAYESGDDEADTYWGMEAYDYNRYYPDDPSISLVIKIYVSQAQ